MWALLTEIIQKAKGRKAKFKGKRKKEEEENGVKDKEETRCSTISFQKMISYFGVHFFYQVQFIYYLSINQKQKAARLFCLV